MIHAKLAPTTVQMEYLSHAAFVSSTVVPTTINCSVDILFEMPWQAGQNKVGRSKALSFDFNCTFFLFALNKMPHPMYKQIFSFQNPLYKQVLLHFYSICQECSAKHTKDATPGELGFGMIQRVLDLTISGQSFTGNGIQL